MTAVFALSLSSQIEKYGSYAGIAAVVGLGVLSLLYFAQAREVKRLREWAGRAPERDSDLQQRVVAEAQRKTVAPPRAQPARPAGPATPAGVAAAGAPAAPAGSVLAAHPGTPTGQKPPIPATAAAAAAATGAAAVTAAGTPAATPNPAVPAAGAPAGTAPATPADPVKAAAAASAVAPSATVAPAAAPPVGGAPPATTPPGASPAPKPSGPVVPAAATAAAQTGAPPAPAADVPPPAAPPAAATPTPGPPRPRPRPPAAPVRASRPEGGIPPAQGAEPVKEGSRRGLLGVILGGVAIVVIAVFLITQVFSGGSDDTSTPKPNSVGTPTTATSGSGSSSAPQPDRAGTRVAVLNGTPVSGLARAAADRLTAVGYKNVSPVATDTTNQSRATTVVYWQSGSRREGVDVAKSIGLGRDALQVMDQNARVLGGGAPVVVIVGADQAK